MKPVCFVSASLFSTHISIENKHVWLPKPCFSFSKSIRCYMNWSFLWEQVFNIWVNILLIISVPVLGWHWIFTTNLLTIINVQVLGLRWIFTTNFLVMVNAPRFLNIGSQSDCLFISSTSLCYISLVGQITTLSLLKSRSLSSHVSFGRPISPEVLVCISQWETIIITVVGENWYWLRGQNVTFVACTASMHISNALWWPLMSEKRQKLVGCCLLCALVSYNGRLHYRAAARRIGHHPLGNDGSPSMCLNRS